MTASAFGQFATVLDIPPGPNLGHDQSIGSSTQVNLDHGGSIGQRFSAGSSGVSSNHIEVNIFDGSVGRGFNAYEGSITNVFGGTIGGRFTFQYGSEANIWGSLMGREFAVSAGSTVTIYGDDFRHNGEPIDGLNAIGDSLQFNLPSGGSVLSGTLSDGTPFSFVSPISFYFTDIIRDGALKLEVVPTVVAGPSAIAVPADPPPIAIREGQALSVGVGGSVGDDFHAGWGSNVLIDGGVVGRRFEAIGAAIDIRSGWVGADFHAYAGSSINMEGGFTDGIDLFDGAEMNLTGGDVFGVRTFGESRLRISGGSIGVRVSEEPGGVTIHADSTAIVTGGAIGSPLSVMSEGKLFVSGGSLPGYVVADDSSAVRLYGSGFLVDGVDVTDALVPNSPLVIADRDGVLSGVLLDGSSFSFDLDGFSPSSHLSVTLTVPGDYNGDGSVDAADYTVWRDSDGTSGLPPWSPGDGDGDGLVGVKDYQVWRDRYGAATGSLSTSDSPPIPEPTTATLLILGAMGVGGWGRRREP